MSEIYLGQLALYGFNYPPRGWAFCQGQILPISQNTALFSLLGVNFGGDGRSTFGLPNLQGVVAIGYGQGNGLSPYAIGETGGEPSVTLNLQTLGPHRHPMVATNAAGTTASSSGNQLARAFAGNPTTGFYSGFQYSPNAPTTTLSPGAAVRSAGGGQPHNNLQPYLSLNWCIALQGVFPQRP